MASYGENPQLHDLGPTNGQDENAAAPEDEMARGSRQVQDTGFNGGQVESERPIEDTRRSSGAQMIGAHFRHLVVESLSRKALTPEAQLYLKTMGDSLKPYGMTIKEMPLDGVYIVTNGTASIGLMFNEVMRSPSIDDEFIPASYHFSRILDDEMFQEKLRKERIQRPDEMVVIPRSDYVDTDANAPANSNRAVRVGNIAANAARNILTLALDAEFDIRDVANYPIRLVTNQNEVAQHIADCCPSGIVPHYQIGVAAEICLDPRAANDRRHGRNLDRDSYDWRPLFVIGATTEFIDTRATDEARYIPVVTITVCESTMKSLKMLPFMLAVAEEIFIQQGMFLEYFRNWGADNPMPNLGQLVIDPRDGLVAPPLTTQLEWDQFVHKWLARPIMAVDVRVGAWNHPALECMLNSEFGIPLLQAELQQLDPDFNLNLTGLVRESADFFCGNLVDDGITVDTRTIDYFKVVKTQQDPAVLEAFLALTDNPEDRIKAIAACGWRTTSQALGRGIKTIESLYDCYRLILDPDIVCDMISLSGNLTILQNLKQSSNYAFEFSILRDIGRVYSRRESSLLRNNTRGYSNFNSGQYIRDLWGGRR